MKKILILTIAALILMPASACGAYVFEESPYGAQSADVVITINPHTVDADIITLSLVIENLSDSEYVTGVDYQIETYRDDAWYTYPPKEDIAWNDIGCIIEAGGVFEDEITINEYYGKLKPGTYRAVKTFYQVGKDSGVAFGQFEVE